MTELANKLYMMQTEIGRLKCERDDLQKQVDELLNEKFAPRGAWGDFCNE
jgi:hypothetical protein